MVFDKEKFCEVGVSREDAIRKCADAHGGPSSRSGIAGDDIAKAE